MVCFAPKWWLHLIVLSAILVLSAGCGAQLSIAPAIPTQLPVETHTSVAPTATQAPPPPAATNLPTQIPTPIPTTLPTTTPSVAVETPTIATTATSIAIETELAPIDEQLAIRLQSILDQTVADGSIPGAVVAVSIPGYQPWVGASGHANRQRTEVMTPDTHVRIASISKMFTAVVVLQLVEEGQLDLDQTIETWFPGFLPNGKLITIRQLLNHTSGLYDYLEDRSFVNQAYRNPAYLWKPRELVAYATQFAPSFRPGAEGQWDYSSTNYVILGMLVEEITGNSLAHEMRTRIFEPLGLNNTFFSPDEEVPAPYATGYSRTTDQSNVSLSFAYATANIVSTAGDVRRFGDALFGGQLLSPASLSLMYTFENGFGSYNMPTLEYGLGIMQNNLPVGPAAGGKRRPDLVTMVRGHIGGFGGFRSALWHGPETGITIALGINQAATDPNILATTVFNAVLTAQGH